MIVIKDKRLPNSGVSHYYEIKLKSKFKMKGR